MSNTDLIETGFAALNDGDIEALKELVDPDCEIRTHFSTLTGRTYHGHRGIGEWYVDVGDTWEWIDQRTERIVELDDSRVVVEVRFRAQGKGSGAVIDQRLALVLTIQGGKLVRLEAHDSFADALAAARGE